MYSLHPPPWVQWPADSQPMQRSSCRSIQGSGEGDTVGSMNGVQNPHSNGQFSCINSRAYPSPQCPADCHAEHEAFLFSHFVGAGVGDDVVGSNAGDSVGEDVAGDFDGESDLWEIQYAHVLAQFVRM